MGWVNRRPCSLGDGRPVHAQGLCSLHYGRLLRVGSTELPPRKVTPVWDRIIRKVTIDPQSGCWVWTGSCSGVGSYGQINIDGQMKYVHVVSYEMHVGPIPDGHQVDHVKARGCTHTQCVWWEHLEAVPALENFRRSTAGGASTSRSGVCRNGHTQTPESVYINPRTGERQCRPCKTARTIESNNRKKALNG